MGLSINKKVWQYMFLVALFLFLIISFLAYIKPVFVALIFGVLVTVLIKKISDIFLKLTEHQTPMKRRAIAVAGSAFMILVIGAALFAGAVNVVNDLENALNLFEDFGNKYNETAEDMAEDLTDITFENNTLNLNHDDDFITGNESERTLNESGPPVSEMSRYPLLNGWNSTYVVQSVLTSGGGLMSSTTETISIIGSTLFASCLIIPIMVGYYFKEKGKLQNKAIRIIPVKYRNTFIHMASNISNDMGTFTIVKFIEAVIITFLYCAGFYVAGLPHWLFAGILMGAFNSVPYVGFILPAIPILVYAYMQGSEVMMATAGIIVIIQLFDFFFILPHMVMKTVNVSSFTAVILTLAGLKVAGVFGLIFAVPIYMFCKIVLVACYKMLVQIYPDPTNHEESILDEG